MNSTKPVSKDGAQSPQEAIAASVRRKAEETNRTVLSFLEAESARISSLALVMADRFQSGGRLLAMGNGGSACDADHIAVEFMHPIIEKRRALPSLSLSSPSALTTAIANDVDFSRIYARQIRQLAGDRDMVLAISTTGSSANLTAAVQEARKLGALSVCFSGRDGGRLKDLVDWAFIVPSFSTHRIQETHVVLLHILWDSIHLALGEEDIV